MSARVDGMGDIQDIYEKKFEVTNEWCLAINNIDYVRESLEPFTRDLGMEQIIQKIEELKSPAEAQRCQHTLENVIANAIDTVRNKIIELLEIVVSKVFKTYSFLFTFQLLILNEVSTLEAVMCVWFLLPGTLLLLLRFFCRFFGSFGHFQVFFLPLNFRLRGS